MAAALGIGTFIIMTRLPSTPAGNHSLAARLRHGAVVLLAGALAVSVTGGWATPASASSAPPPAEPAPGLVEPHAPAGADAAAVLDPDLPRSGSTSPSPQAARAARPAGPRVARAAADSLITFSEFPLGTSITDQYRDQGLTFSSPDTAVPPFISSDGSNPTSPVLSGYPQFSGNISAQFVVPSTTTATSVDAVTVDVGYVDNPGSIQLLAFTPTGVDVISADAYGINTLTSTVGNIYAFQVVQSADEPAGFAIDNVMFTPGDRPVVGLAGGDPTEGETAGEGNPGSPLVACGIRLCGDPVNTATGNLTETIDDIRVQGAGPGLSLSRTYNSVAADRAGIFGNGWTSTWESSVDVVEDTATVTFGNGSQVIFQRTPLGWFAAPRVTARLSIDDAGASEVILGGGRETLTFDADGRLTTWTDSNTRTVSLDHSDPSQVVVSDDAGRSVLLELEDGHVVSATDPAGSVTTYEYDGGDLVGVVDALGGTTTFGYDAEHRLTEMTDAEDDTTTTDYDAEGRATRQVDPRGGVTTFDYGDDGVTTITEPDGTVSAHHYENGLLVLAEDAVGTPVAGAWTYEYDATTAGRTSETTPDGATVTRSFDARGNITSLTDPEGRVSTYTYDDLGNRTSTTYPSGRIDTADYDGAGNLVLYTEDAEGLALTTYYPRSWPTGDLTGVVSPRGAATEIATDERGLLTEVVDPDGRVLQVEYDVLGRETSRRIVADPADADANDLVTRQNWDALSRLVRLTDPAGDATLTSYDAVGRVVGVTDPRGGETTTTYAPGGDPTLVRLPDGSETTSTYDDEGKLLTRTTPTGGTWRYSYDGRDRQTAWTDPLGRRTARTYDAADRVATSTSASGATVTTTYDDSGLVTRKTYSDGTPTATWTYDADGQRASMEDGTGTTAYEWDGAGRLASTSTTAGAVSYSYDADDHVEAVSYPSGREVQREYTPGGELAQLDDGAGNTSTFETNSLGQTDTFRYANGVVGSWSFADGGQVTGARYESDGAMLAEYTAGITTGGLVSQTTATAPQETEHAFDYNPLAQLASVDGTPTTYDAESNLLLRPDGVEQEFDAAGQLVSAGTGEAGEPEALRVRGTSSAPVTPNRSRARTGMLTVRAGDSIVVLVTQGRRKAKRGVGAARVSAPGVRLVRRKSAAGKAGRVQVWSGVAAADSRTRVTVTAGARHGRGVLAATVVDGVGDLRAARANGRRGVAALSVRMAAGELAVGAVAARTNARPQVTSDSRAIRVVRDRPRSYAGAVVASSATRAGNIQLGLRTRANASSSVAVVLSPRPTAPEGETTFGYSPNGERTSETTGGEATRYGYDAEHRLTSVSAPGEGTIRYAYDGDGLRRSTTSGGTTRQFTYDHSGELPMLLDDGESELVYGPGDAVLEQVSGDTVRFLHLNTQGDVALTTDEGGATAGSTSYGPTGVVEEAVGFVPVLGYKSQYTDDTGLLYLRARYYDPVTAAFLTRDPLVSITGSAYGYAGGNPISFADPSGLIFVSCSDILSGINNLGGLATDIASGLAVRASLLGRALGTSPSQVVRSYAGRNLRTAGQLLRNPAIRGLRFLGRGMPIIGAGLTYGSHVLDGDSQAESIGGTVGATVGGLAGGAAGGAACGAVGASTFGLGLATCPVLIAGGGLVGGLIGDFVGSAVGGWVGRRWF